MTIKSSLLLLIGNLNCGSSKGPLRHVVGIEGFRVALTANGKGEIRVYVFLKKVEHR